MWYRSAKEQNQQKKPRQLNYEGKILQADAERVIRQRLFLKGKYSPTQREVAAYVEKVLVGLEQRYGSLNNVRRHIQGEDLLPAVEEAVRKLFS